MAIELIPFITSLVPYKVVISDSLDFLDLYYHPIANQFWFIKDLFIVCLMSILIYFFLRYLNGVGLVFLFILWGLNIDITLGLIQMRTLCLFSLGGFLRIMNYDIIALIKKNIYLIALFPILLLLFYWNSALYELNFLFPILALSSIIFGLYIAKYNIIKQSNFAILLSSASFFMFASFEPFMICLKKLLFYLIKPQDNVLILALAILMVCIVVVSVMLYYLLSLIAPKFLHVITGGR